MSETTLKQKYSKRYVYYLLAVSGGVFISLSSMYSLFLLMWFGIVPLFFIVEGNTFKQTIPYLFIISMFAGALPFMWMYEVVQRYSGTQTQLGFILILFPPLIFFITILVFSFFYSILLKDLTKVTYKIIGTASLWVIVEWIGTYLLKGIPWHDLNLAYTQVTDLYILQIASWGGIWAVSFIVIVINYYIYQAIVRRNIKQGLYAIVILLAIHIYGFACVVIVNNKSKKSNLEVAVITENVKPEDRWADNTGEATEEIFYKLNEEAKEGNPNLIVWTESAVPWAFETNNSFIINALGITYSAQAFHLMGLMMPNPKDTSMATNSAVFFAPDGAINARYDKQELLKFLERPVVSTNWKIPFLTEGLMNNLYSTQKIKPLNTPLGKIGVLICNESLRPFIARDLALKGAQYFITMSNDSWFEHTRMDFLHFYISRIRAIENRRSMIVNSNRGFSGSIKPSGEIEVLKNEKIPYVFFNNVTFTSDESFYSKRGDLFIVIPVLIIVILIFNKIKNKL